MRKISILIISLLQFNQISISQKVIPLYPGVAPGSETWNWDEADNNKNIFNTRVVYNVSKPSITAYLPNPKIANGTAIIVAPGGAFHILSIDSEGVEVAKWLNARGVAAFVLKYRVVKSDSNDPIKELMAKMTDFNKLDIINAPVIPLAIQDGLTAMKYVRENAKEFLIKPDKIGFMGFSAGGTLSMSVIYNANDSNRPNFVAPIYAYEKAIIGNEIPKVKTPIFIAAATDDNLGLASHSTSIYNKWLDAKQPAELHMYEKGSHGFGMRKNNINTDTWIDRFGEWMQQQGYLPQPAAPGFGQRLPSPNDTLTSVKVLSNNTLQFNIYAPDAKKITVSGDFPDGFPGGKLVKDLAGVWSFTTSKPVSPDIYTYDFTIDGIKTIDPKNSQVKISGNGFSNLFEAPGLENNFQTMKDVPHGKLEMAHYTSKALGGIGRRLHVYLPPNYNKSKKPLPVLYLLHGGGDNDASWSSAGRANIILDNLYAEGKLRDMIVVMPNGHTPITGLAMGAGPEQDPFCRDFLQDIIPFIESNYRVSKKKEHRALAGLSMGGIQTLNLALWNPQLFSYVYPMSTGYFTQTIKELDEKHDVILKNPAINQFKLFTIGMGKEDPLAYKNNKDMMALFEKKGIKFNYSETSGGHTYLVWRKNLAYITPLLFR